MAIDSHMHINSIVLKNNQAYIDNINNNPYIESVINVGLNMSTSNETFSIAQQNPKFYSAIGIHPLYIETQDPNFLFTLADNEKVVAIGEIGLDDTKNNLEQQRKIFGNSKNSSK